jgi:hypothetical protein
MTDSCLYVAMVVRLWQSKRHALLPVKYLVSSFLPLCFFFLGMEVYGSLQSMERGHNGLINAANQSARRYKTAVGHDGAFGLFVSLEKVCRQ